jgi:hypothetical protein
MGARPKRIPVASEIKPAVFRGSRRRVVSGAGVSLSVRGGLTVDVGGTLGGDRSELAAGARFRF